MLECQLDACDFGFFLILYHEKANPFQKSDEFIPSSPAASYLVRAPKKLSDQFLDLIVMSH
jgi:hypothetical protein